MEKCSFCSQRIAHAKDRAKDEKRKLKEGEVVTACQQACACNAIEFGDLNDSKSKVAKLGHDARSYTLLSELNTRPSVSYLKKISWDKV
jgi:molybdopterin-containing oxidoreductase family iron-sulfur binding subunit|tara:strand:- start:2029 stop:2295 length:267 start_codon:yes stop_codon:yes gene_type:complete